MTSKKAYICFTAIWVSIVIVVVAVAFIGLFLFWRSGWDNTHVAKTVGAVAAVLGIAIGMPIANKFINPYDYLGK